MENNNVETARNISVC